MTALARILCARRALELIERCDLACEGCGTWRAGREWRDVGAVRPRWLCATCAPTNPNPNDKDNAQ